jgi:PKD repeat protein
MLSAVLAAVLVLPVSLVSTGTAPASAATPSAAAVTAAAATPALRMPSDVPSKKTPWVLDGEVTKVVQVGSTMVAAGLFTTVSDPMNGTQYSRTDIFAFDKATGVVSQTFVPTVDGQVQQMLPGPTPGTVYVAGDFSKVNGKGPGHIALLDVTTGATVSSFTAPTTNGGIETMEVLANNRLFIGGFFTKIGGVAHGQLATLNATTGALDPYMNITVAGHHNSSGSGAQAPIGPRESDVTPGGDRLVVVGNFKTAAGLARDQIVMVNLDATSASVSTTWATTLYSPICSPTAFDSYMRDVEMSPDGSYFVVSSTGGPHSGTLCDSATRWDPYATGTTLSPTWVANSGGDTLWGVGITDAAVYVGGHERWMNNPNGSDRAGQGAVARPGLVALDPTTGVPLRWNPGRNPRGEAAYDIYPVDDGIYVVSDTDWIGDRRYQRPRLAFFPNSEGYDVASTTPGSLPGNVYIASSDNVLYRVNAGGAQVAATDGGPNWVADNSSTSPYHNTGSTTATRSALTSAGLVNVPSTTPLGIWTSERNDPTGGNEMQWSFPVSAGAGTTVRLYFASRSTTTSRFNVSIDGVSKLSGYEPNADPGVNKGTMKSFDITSDGTVNIDFTHVVGNPEVNAVEILGPPSSATSAKVVSFDGSSASSPQSSTTSNFDWTNVRGAVMVGRTLFYGSTDGMLYKRSFDGVSFGDPVAVNPYHDPLWNTVQTGSGQTYDGATPTWYGQLGSVTGMFYTSGRLYYTLSGTNSLFWRSFVPDSGVVSPTQNTATGGSITWTSTKGMFLDGSNLYTVSSTDGSLSRTSFVNGAPAGASTVVNSVATGGIDWRGRAVFLASVLPNVAPKAAFTQSCHGITCDFDGSGSSDSDGTVDSYAWDFGDGGTSGAPAPSHDFTGTGTYSVTLTVTDDAGTSTTVTHDVSVTKPNDPPSAAFTVQCTYLDCTFDGSGSTDGDGTVESYRWDLGGGATDTGQTVSHSFDEPGDYTVGLEVTDDEGATSAVTTKTFTLTAAPASSTVSYVDSAVAAGNVSTPNVTTSRQVAAGDRLLMVLSLNAATRVLSDPTGVTGWTVLGTTTTSGMATTVYTKPAAAGDAGRKVTVPLDGAAKYTLTVADYRGARAGSVVSAKLAETVNRAAHPTPAVTVPPGAWVVSHWADKTSLTTGFALPAGVTSRAALCGTSTGRICSVLADSDGAVPAGSYGPLTATADSSSSNATMWSVVLRTVEPNVAPDAEFAQTCSGAVCDFDASASTDSDGAVTSYAWDFGDGGSGSGSLAQHDFRTSGARQVSLTVTDDEGASTTVTHEVSVTRANTAPVAQFSSSCTFLECDFDATASSDPDGTIASYAWEFGDGGTGADVTSHHGFSSTGTRDVTLTVTDNDGTSTSLTKQVAATAIRPITHVGTAVKTGNLTTPNVNVPAAASPGDRLVMALTLNVTSRTLSDPTGVTGWQALGSPIVSGGMATTVYTKLAEVGDPGRKVTVTLDAAAKFTMSLGAYSGDMGAPTFASAGETVNRATHTTPTLADVPDGAVVLSSWADKSSTATPTGFVLPSGVTQRAALCGTSTGHICTAVADSAGAVAAGPYGGLTATGDSSQATATMWTLSLNPVVQGTA